MNRKRPSAHALTDRFCFSIRRDIPELLAGKIRQHDATVWLVSTGWAGGAYGVGSRMPLRFTAAIIGAIHNGALKTVPVVTDDIFGFDIVTTCEGVPSEMMQPKQSCRDQGPTQKHQAEWPPVFNRNLRRTLPKPVRKSQLPGRLVDRTTALSSRRTCDLTCQPVDIACESYCPAGMPDSPGGSHLPRR